MRRFVGPPSPRAKQTPVPALRLDVAARLPEKGEIEAAQPQRPLVEDDVPGTPRTDRFREIGRTERVAALYSRFATPVPDDSRHDPLSVKRCPPASLSPRIRRREIRPSVALGRRRERARVPCGAASRPLKADTRPDLVSRLPALSRRDERSCSLRQGSGRVPAGLGLDGLDRPRIEVSGVASLLRIACHRHSEK
jgi:hypothetical protein